MEVEEQIPKNLLLLDNYIRELELQISHTKDDSNMNEQAKRITIGAIIMQIKSLVDSENKTLSLATPKTETVTAVATKEGVGVQIQRSHIRSVMEIYK